MSITDARHYRSLQPGYRRELAQRKRLAAAAPDLLAACEAIIAWADDPVEDTRIGLGENEGWVSIKKNSFAKLWFEVVEKARSAARKANP